MRKRQVVKGHLQKGACGDQCPDLVTGEEETGVRAYDHWLSAERKHTLRNTHRLRRTPAGVPQKYRFKAAGLDSGAIRGRQLHGGGRRDWEEVRSLWRNRYEVGLCCKRKKH